MPTKRKYSNATFTKRVDHEAGRHRPSRAMSEPAVCEDCGAEYAKRRWTAGTSDSLADQREHWRPPQMTLCPACAQIRSGEPRGFVYLDGGFFESHDQEIRWLLLNESERAAVDNPLARIIWHNGWGTPLKKHSVAMLLTIFHMRTNWRASSGSESELAQAQLMFRGEDYDGSNIVKRLNKGK